jgi:hypothetical protein
MGRLAIAVAVAAIGALSAFAQQPDPFYSELERDGRAALARGEGGEASRLLRIACFGMLDAPERLGACLVRLGLAQVAAADNAGFDQTFRRLQTVEERFGVWARLTVEAEERGAFEKLAAQRIPAALLRSQPAFAHLAPAAAAADKSARAEKRPKPPAEVKPSKAKAAPTRAPAPPASPKVEAAPLPAPAPAQPAAWTEAERDALARARPLTTAAASFDAIEGALAEVRPVADRHPEDVDAHRLVAVLAYRASRWDLCAEAFQRAGPPPESEPLTRFYMAVCLYETGDATGAAELVRASSAQLARTPFVDRYLKLILGPGAVVP